MDRCHLSWCGTFSFLHVRNWTSGGSRWQEAEREQPAASSFSCGLWLPWRDWRSWTTTPNVSTDLIRFVNTWGQFHVFVLEPGRCPRSFSPVQSNVRWFSANHKRASLLSAGISHVVNNPDFWAMLGLIQTRNQPVSWLRVETVTVFKCF